MTEICPQSLIPYCPSGRITLKDLLAIQKNVNKINKRTQFEKTTKTPETALERRERQRNYYATHPEYRKMKNARQKAYDDAHRDHIREYHKARYQRLKAKAPTAAHMQELAGSVA